MISWVDFPAASSRAFASIAGVVHSMRGRQRFQYQRERSSQDSMVLMRALRDGIGRGHTGFGKVLGDVLYLPCVVNAIF